MDTFDAKLEVSTSFLGLFDMILARIGNPNARLDAVYGCHLTVLTVTVFSLGLYRRHCEISTMRCPRLPQNACQTLRAGSLVKKVIAFSRLSLSCDPGTGGLANGVLCCIHCYFFFLVHSSYSQ